MRINYYTIIFFIEPLIKRLSFVKLISLFLHIVPFFYAQCYLVREKCFYKYRINCKKEIKALHSWEFKNKWVKLNTKTQRFWSRNFGLITHFNNSKLRLIIITIHENSKKIGYRVWIRNFMDLWVWVLGFKPKLNFFLSSHVW